MGNRKEEQQNPKRYSGMDVPRHSQVPEKLQALKNIVF